jgi:hypothetical protein
MYKYIYINIYVPGLTAMFPLITDGGMVEIPALDKMVKSPADRRLTGLGPRYVFIYIYVFTCIYIYVCIYIYMYIFMYKYKINWLYIYIYIYIYNMVESPADRRLTGLGPSNTDTDMYIYVHIYAYDIFMNIYINLRSIGCI